MPIKHLNFTGRKKINREHAQIWISETSDGKMIFDVSLNLTEYDLHPDANVFVEAYLNTSYMRFSYGTVSAPIPPDELDRSLTEFYSRDGLLFRVKVTSTGDTAGMLLAEADGLHPKDDEERPDNRIPLLPPRPEDLGQEMWRVNFETADGPELLVNRRVADWKDTASHPLFRSLVYPAAMRQVLWHIYQECIKANEPWSLEDSDGWQSQWMEFAGALPNSSDLPSTLDSDDWEDWINRAVGGFARRHNMFNVYENYSMAEAS